MKWKVPTLARIADGWSMNTDTMGVYGNYYLKRAIVAQLGLGANVPEDAIYPLNLADKSGQPLDGANSYAIHFDKGQTPPADAFWSVTLYDPEGFQVPTRSIALPLAVGCRLSTTPMARLTSISRTRARAEREANWLPAPKGPFNLTMRLYAPKSDALTGKWNPPPVVKSEPLSRTLTTQ